MFGHYKNIDDIYSRRIDINSNDPVCDTRLECHRAITFEYFPTSLLYLTPSMAKTGLFWTKTGDETQCFDCNVIFGNWCDIDIPPAVMHLNTSPNCNMANNKCTNNISDELLRSERWRLSTFLKDNKLYSIDPATLAKCGFYLTNVTNEPSSARIKCFECGLEMQLWHVMTKKTTTDINSLHCALNGNCLFVRNQPCGNIEYENYALESHRVRSFETCRNVSQAARDRYAARGFAHISNNKLTCFSCFIQIKHQRNHPLIGWGTHEPDCAFATGKRTNNIPRTSTHPVTVTTYEEAIALNNIFYQQITEVKLHFIKNIYNTIVFFFVSFLMQLFILASCATNSDTK
ncbi:E3 ubiquitin-protein ligase IAP-3 [Dolichomitus sp. PSUC_FEM 10030005]|nr:E3 ubiquitin-protein ligase IAP-3 [Dolichomitus sp. PSUC_FEM 10030005]